MKLTSHNPDAIASGSPSFLHDLDGRPSWLPFYPCSAVITIPLSRGTAKQHPIQPIDKVVRPEILVIHGPWIRCVLPSLRHLGKFYVLTLQQVLRSESQSGRRRRANKWEDYKAEKAVIEFWLYI